MATIKSFTSLEQSKVLAEILPLESADMRYVYYNTGEYSTNPSVGVPLVYLGNKDIPTWSLSALLDALIYPHIEQNYMGQLVCRVEQQNTTYLCEGSNPVDACVAMIIKLHKLNLL